MISRCFSRRLLMATLVLATAIGAFSAPKPVAAADNPITYFPEDTGVLIHFRQPQSFIKKVIAFGGELGPDIGLALTFGSGQFNNVIRNEQLQGVDQNGDWFHAIYFRRDGRPADVTAVKVTDVDAATEGVRGSENFTFANYKGWLFYSRDAWAVKKFERHFRTLGRAGAVKSLADALGKKCGKIVNSTDISFFVNVPAIRKEYKEELKLAKENIDAELDNLQDFDQNPQVDMKAVMTMAKGIIGGLFQAADDTEGLALGITVTKQGIGFEDYVQFKKGSPSLKVLSQHKPSALANINKLPPGQLIYFGATGNFEAFRKWAAKHIPAIMKDEKQRKTIKGAINAFAGVSPKSYVGSFSIGTLKEGILRTVAIEEPESVEKLKAANRKGAAAIAKANLGPVKTEIELNKNVETYGTFKADVLRVKPDLENIPPELDPLGLQKMMLEAMYGKGATIETRMIYTDKYLVQIVGGKELAKKAVEALAEKTAKAERAPVLAARNVLTKQANLILMIDIANMAGTAVRTIAGAEDLNLPIPKGLFKDQVFKPSYISMSLGIDDTGVAGKAYIPIAQVKNITALVRKAIAEFSGGAQPEL